MSAVHLARIDPARNMCRFYRLDVQPEGPLEITHQRASYAVEFVGRCGICGKAGFF